MKALILILAAFMLVLQYRLWVGDGSLSEVWGLSEAVAAQQEKNDWLEARNQAMEAEVHDLKKGTEAVEERARSELGMIMKGETFYQVLDAVPTASFKKAGLDCDDPKKCYLPGFGP